MSQAILSVFLSLAAGNLVTESRPNYMSAGRFLHANIGPSAAHLDEPYQNMFQKSSFPSSPFSHEGIESSGIAGISLASQLVHDSYMKPGKVTYGQGSPVMASKPGQIKWTLTKNSEPMLGMLKHLLNGNFHIVADAVHVDAIPLHERPMQSYIEGMIIEPSNPIAHAHNDMEPVLPMYFGPPDSGRPHQIIPQTNVHPNNVVQPVPLELLLKEFNDMNGNGKLKPNEHVVTFAKLYQNYMRLLEKQKTTSSTMLSTDLPTTSANSTTLPTTSETKISAAVIITPTSSMIYSTKKKEDANLNKIPNGKSSDDKQVMRLPGMGPEMPTQ
ncbi:uncharacterized protein LOC132562225 [Ylistrum balloti]|uniref:uncharacterized protein LOC132562225 n=1 Tax=Ylistrum balloti TaxID=509963 RepID=UPI002905C4A1|nr:uncharacterized protein LOC132562225 [Ylistrum balloti]